MDNANFKMLCDWIGEKEILTFETPSHISTLQVQMVLVTLANKGNLEQTIKKIETELDHVWYQTNDIQQNKTLPWVISDTWYSYENQMI